MFLHLDVRISMYVQFEWPAKAQALNTSFVKYAILAKHAVYNSKKRPKSAASLRDADPDQYSLCMRRKSHVLKISSYTAACHLHQYALCSAEQAPGAVGENVACHELQQTLMQLKWCITAPHMSAYRSCSPDVKSLLTVVQNFCVLTVPLLWRSSGLCADFRQTCQHGRLRSTIAYPPTYTRQPCSC